VATEHEHKDLDEEIEERRNDEAFVERVRKRHDDERELYGRLARGCEADESAPERD
jgi:hypothetical protein